MSELHVVRGGRGMIDGFGAAVRTKGDTRRIRANGQGQDVLCPGRNGL